MDTPEQFIANIADSQPDNNGYICDNTCKEIANHFMEFTKWALINVDMVSAASGSTDVYVQNTKAWTRMTIPKLYEYWVNLDEDER